MIDIDFLKLKELVEGNNNYACFYGDLNHSILKVRICNKRFVELQTREGGMITANKLNLKERLVIYRDTTEEMSDLLT